VAVAAKAFQQPILAQHRYGSKKQSDPLRDQKKKSDPLQ
jgi:hypothetical protein